MAQVAFNYLIYWSEQETNAIFFRLMVLAEIFSLLLYVLSLVILHDYFGECFELNNIKNSLSLNILKLFNFHCRLGLHLVVWIPVESVGNHISLLFASVHNQISTQKVLTAGLLKIVLKSAVCLGSVCVSTEKKQQRPTVYIKYNQYKI